MLLVRARNKAVSSKNEELVAGLTVWLHSLRAVNHPELRVLGRRLWGILARGFDTSQDLALILSSQVTGEIGYRLLTEHNAIPGGLEPRDGEGNEYMPGRPGIEVMESLAEQVRQVEDYVKATTRDAPVAPDVPFETMQAQLSALRASLNSSRVQRR